MTVPRLELVAAHMTTNLMENTQSALKTYPIDRCYAWADSTVVLFWLKTKYRYKEFATNRVLKISEKNYIEEGMYQLNFAISQIRGKIGISWEREYFLPWPKNMGYTN